MIRGLLLFSLSFLMACNGCATTGAAVNITHQNVSAAVMAADCLDPVEVHNVPPFRFPIPAQLTRHHGCQNVDDMLVVLWPLEPTKTNIAAAELLMMMYVDYQNEKSPETVLVATFIKVDSFDNDGTIVQAAFYELTESPRVVEEVEE